MTPPDEHGSSNGISVRRALRTALSDNTRRAYRSGWRRFADYCDRRRVDPMAATPENVAEFLVAVAAAPGSSQAGPNPEQPLALGTIRICLAAINRRYGDRNLDSPARDATVTSVLRGLGRLLGERPRQVKALREHEIAAMLSCCDRIGARTEQRALATSRDRWLRGRTAKVGDLPTADRPSFAIGSGEPRTPAVEDGTRQGPDDRDPGGGVVTRPI